MQKMQLVRVKRTKIINHEVFSVWEKQKNYPVGTGSSAARNAGLEIKTII